MFHGTQQARRHGSKKKIIVCGLIDFFSIATPMRLCKQVQNKPGEHFLFILTEGAIALSVTLSGGALFAS